jgi:hypothetical protein
MTSLSKGEESNGEENFVLFKNNHIKEPKYWQYIDMIAPNKPRPANGWTNADAVGIYCKKCSTKFSYQKGSSQSVRNHMIKHHMTDLDAFLKKKEDAEKKSRKIMDNFLIGTTPIKKMRTARDAEQDKFSTLLIEWICKSLRPISVVEDGGFKELLNYVNSLGTSISIPSRNTVAQKLTESANKLRIKLKEILKEECSYYCATTDIWSSRALDSFMSYTLHYLTADFTMRHWTLEVTPFGGQHTGQRIADRLNQVMAEWNLEKKNLILMLRDNASNAVLSCKILEIESFGCIAHTLHLVLAPLLFTKKKRLRGPKAEEPEAFGNMNDNDNSSDDTVVSNDELSLTKNLALKVKTLRNLAKYFSNSPKSSEKLKNFQNSNKKYGCILDVVTRWSSTYLMLERLIFLRPSIDAFMSYIVSPVGKKEYPNFTKEKPTIGSWLIAEGLVILLKPFYTGTLLLSGEEYPSMSLAFPVLRFIKKSLCACNVFDDLNTSYNYMAYSSECDKKLVEDTITLLGQVKDYLLKNFCEQFTKMPMFIIAASVLHPGITNKNYLSSTELKASHEFIIDEMILCANHPNETTTAAVVDDNQPVSNSWHDVFRTANDDDNDSINSLDDNVHEATLKLKCCHELKKYLASAKAFSSSISGQDVGCPLKWWNLNYKSFELLAPVARKLLCILAGSVPSERCFSVSGNVVTPLRSSLGKETIRDICFLHDNISK